MSGGAGAFSLSIHSTMLNMGVRSRLITREQNNVEGAEVISPKGKLEEFARWRLAGFLGRVGLNDNRYAMFGIGRAPVKASSIKGVMSSCPPKAILFYWVSWFVDFDCINELRQAFPETLFLFICLDEGYLTGGCHFSWGCEEYQRSCRDCPATLLPFLKRRIEREFQNRVELNSKIDPVVIYPTSIMQNQGRKSSALKGLRSSVIPLGAISEAEKDKLIRNQTVPSLDVNEERKLVLLVRSSKEYRKGCDLLVEALAVLSDEFKNLRSRLKVLSIGDEALSDFDIGRYVDHEDLSMVSRGELLLAYKSADFLLVTSREDAGPLMINESIALNTFVLSTPVGVANDIIQKGVNGEVVEAITGKDIARGISRILRGELDVDSVREGGLAGISGLTFENYVKRILSMLDSSGQNGGEI